MTPSSLVPALEALWHHSAAGQSPKPVRESPAMEVGLSEQAFPLVSPFTADLRGSPLSWKAILLWQAEGSIFLLVYAYINKSAETSCFLISINQSEKKTIVSYWKPRESCDQSPTGNGIVATSSTSLLVTRTTSE